MEDLYRYTGIIYLIRNRVNGMCYVGQTTLRFVDRYHAGKWWRGTNNPYLKSAASKYGTDAFDVTLLAHSKTPEDLNRLEAEYATLYNVYAPHGYNLVQCGESKRQHPDSVRKRSRTVTVNDPSGRDVTITNVRKFCRDNNLHYRSFSRVLQGSLNVSQGWSRAGVTTKHHRNNHSYVFFDRAGTRHEIIGLTQFCRERGLVYHGMRTMAQGKLAQSQGFALSMDGFGKAKQRHVVTLTNGSNDIVLHNVKAECRAHGLHSKHVYQLISGVLDIYKGWRLKDLSSEQIAA